LFIAKVNQSHTGFVFLHSTNISFLLRKVNEKKEKQNI